MNDLISWDSSLVKKFSSSNHFKLLNQLKNEVKKYPLNKNKNLASMNSADKKINSIKTVAQDETNLKESKFTNDKRLSSSKVSFNNSKNFSIYNNLDTDYSKSQKESKLIEERKSKDENSSTTFKDRLNQIDLK